MSAATQETPEVWLAMSRLRFREVSPFTRRIDEAEAAMHAAVADLLASLNPPEQGRAGSAFERIRQRLDALRETLSET